VGFPTLPDCMADRIPFRATAMLATLVDQPFDAPGWVYEEKYDGVRILAYKDGKQATLLSRNGIDRSQGYATIAGAVKALRPRTLLLDGEVVAFDRSGVSRFQLLQQGNSTLHYAVFDLLFCDGKDLRRKPLSERRTLLEKIVPASKEILISRRLAADGMKAYATAKKKGYEGLVAKDSSSPYIAGRSRFWLKVKVHQEDEFIIVGYTAPAGARQHFGALLLGAYKGQKLLYVGKVGTGFSHRTLASLLGKFRPLAQKNPSVENPPRERDVTYVKPRLVAQIAYEEWTADQKLRQPVFLGLRDDKSAKDVVIAPPVKTRKRG
jgi:bifunctional non-homologous end joining protein LigD